MTNASRAPGVAGNGALARVDGIRVETHPPGNRHAPIIDAIDPGAFASQAPRR